MEETFAAVLKRLLEEKNISAAELSRRSGVSKPLLSDYLKGKYEPKLKNIEAIAKALDVDPFTLYSFDQATQVLENSITDHKTVTDDDIRFALFDGADNITDEMYEEVKRFAEALGTSSCYLLDGKETSKDFVSSFALTEREKALVIAYRNHPDMQKSVDKLLGIESEEKLYIIEKAARNGDNTPLVVTDSKLKELENLPEVPLEDG